MENYIKTDDNEACIRWVKKMGDCLEVCTKTTGYNTHPKYKDTPNYMLIINSISILNRGVHGTRNGHKTVIVIL